MVNSGEIYLLEEYEPDNFSFVTANENEYKVGFIKSWHVEILAWHIGTRIKVYEMYFEEVQIKKKIKDERISATLINIAHRYLLRDCVLYFMTDRKDGRSDMLFRVYNQWYNKIRDSYEDCSKLNREIYWNNKLQSRFGCLFKSELFNVNTLDNLLEIILQDIYPNSTYK